MSVAVITSAAGLIGSEAARHFAGEGMDVVGVERFMPTMRNDVWRPQAYD